MKNNPLIIFSLALAFFQFILVSILAAMLFTSCSEQVSTELTSSSVSGNLKLEIVAEHPGIYVYTNGYDTTGILDPLLKTSTFISVSGIKNTNYRNSTADDYYFTQFSDKNNPAYNKEKNVIGFPGVNAGEVRFNNNLAAIGENRIKFNEQDKNRDTTLGSKYSYSTKLNNPPGTNKFPYGQSVNFSLDTRIGGPNGIVQFDIPTPTEITGKIQMQGSLAEENLKMNLEWNGQAYGNVEVVLGLLDGKSLAFPLFKITTNDNGKLKIPQSVVDKLAAEGTKELLVTFIRKKVREEAKEIFQDKDNYIVAQSIHNIKIQLP